MFESMGSDELSEGAARVRTMMRLAESGVRALAGADAGELSSEDLRELSGSVEEVRRFLDAAQAHLLVELDDRRVTDARSGLSTSKWLARRAALPVGVARQRLVVARRLSVLPAVDAALSEGRIGYDHARVLAEVINDRNLDAISPVLEDLIAAAPGTVFARWRQDVTALAALLDPDGSHDPAGDVAADTLTMSPSDRFMVGRFELTGERALTVHDTLHAVADELFHQCSRDREQFPELEMPSRATLLALALEEVCRRALAVDRATTTAPRVEATLTLHTDLPANDCGCGHHDVVVGDDSPAGDRDPALRAIWWIHNSMGSPLPAAVVPSFLCDPVFYAVVVDSLGVTRDLGRSARSVSPSQRRALTVRDGGCVFPGCDCPAAWTDAHHLEEWTRDVGPTDLDNPTCRQYPGTAVSTEATTLTRGARSASALPTARSGPGDLRSRVVRECLPDETDPAERSA